MTSVASSQTTVVDVCAYDRLTPDLGAAALVGDVQVALFRLPDGSVHALGNVCPFSGAAVMSRGITGTRGEVPTVASPVYKQVFSLLDGRCLDPMGMEPRPGRGQDLPVYPVRVNDGRVAIELVDGE
ncbi:nitrite reductase small subunit NirD [Phycicoccus sp. CSK15P-2]|uniref:nitrite reductase small subunit NirD n=1 Tax=Phycicoccus sp. CSK15P-2 TaxID=2807627 RepID=UPI001950A567|nr:nitrite reductase small subunit NirD [Phycicoccus sp. CSK15P-2]MBM6404981.1 nitrite reductase small subunit NirD [Phycicoccus sp. CSK15P-2]